MKKILGNIITLSTFAILTSNCFGAQIDLGNEAWNKKIVQQMVASRDLDGACVKKFKNRLLEMIIISGISLSMNGEDGNTFLIKSNPAGPCFLGNQTEATWIYKQKDNKGNLVKIFGPEYPVEIKPVEEYSNHGLKEIEVIYPAGNFHPETSRFYRFDGKKYQLIKN